MIWFEIVLKLIENGFDFVWKFVRNMSNTSFKKRSWNNWVVLKRTDRWELFLPPELLVNTSQILSSLPSQCD